MCVLMLIYEQFTTCFGQNDHLQVYILYISKLNITYNVEMLFVTTIKLLKFVQIYQFMNTFDNIVKFVKS
jgi:hypothetical protein